MSECVSGCVSEWADVVTTAVVVVGASVAPVFVCVCVCVCVSVRRTEINAHNYPDHCHANT